MKLKKRAEIEKVEMLESDVEQLYDDISVKVTDQTVDRTTSSILNESKLASESKLISEFEYETKLLAKNKKKKFRRDHL